jgi:hypothetical protein
MIIIQLLFYKHLQNFGLFIYFLIALSVIILLSVQYQSIHQENYNPSWNSTCGTAMTAQVLSDASGAPVNSAVYFYCINNSGSGGVYGGLKWSGVDYSSYNSTINSTFSLNPTANPNQYHLLITVSGNLTNQPSIANTILYLNYLGGAVGETSYITVQNNTNGGIYVTFGGGSDGTTSLVPGLTVYINNNNNVVFQCSQALFEFGLYGGNYQMLNL